MTLAELVRTGRVEVLHNGGASTWISVRCNTPRRLTAAVVAVVKQHGKVVGDWDKQQIKCEIPTRAARRYAIPRRQDARPDTQEG
jgi:hypothetical protein